MINLLIIIPFWGILRVLFSTIDPSRKEQQDRLKKIALRSSILTFILSLIIMLTFDNSLLTFQYVEEYKALYFLEFNLGIDGISLPFILLTTLTMPICLLSSWNNIKIEVKSFLIAFLLLEMLLITVFLSLDLLLFYVFFESVLPPLFLIIGVWGHGQNKVRASYLLFLYTLIGSLFMLLSILGFMMVIGSSNYHLLFLTDLTSETQLLLWLGFFIALAVKTPLYPFHIWLYRAHAEAPLAGSVLLAGVILKLATYGFIRVLLAMLPESTFYFIPFVQGLAVITILYSALTTLRQTDLKCCIAYSSVTHMGFIILALCSNNLQGIEGAILLSIAHGLVSPALFICVGGVLYDRYKTRIIKYYRGLTLTMPLFSTLFFLFILGNISVPLSLNFVGEFLALAGSFTQNPILTSFAALGMVLGAFYTFFVFKKTMFGSFSMYLNPTGDANKRELAILLLLAVLTYGLGLFPNLVLDNLHTAVSGLLFNVTEEGSILFFAGLLLKSHSTKKGLSERSMSNQINKKSVNVEESDNEVEFFSNRDSNSPFSQGSSSNFNELYQKYSSGDPKANFTKTNTPKNEGVNTEEEKANLNESTDETIDAGEKIFADFVNEHLGGAAGAVTGSMLGTHIGPVYGYCAADFAQKYTKKICEEVGAGEIVVELIKERIPEDFPMGSTPPSPSIYPHPHAQYDGFFSSLLSFFYDLKDRILEVILNICDQLYFMYENLLSVYHQTLGWLEILFNNYACQLFLTLNSSDTVTFPVDLPTFISLIASIRNLLFISFIPITILTLLCFIIILKFYIIRFKKDKEYSNPIIKKYVEFLKGLKLYNVYYIFFVILLISILLASIYFSINFNIKIAINILDASPSWEKGPYIMPYLDGMLTYVYLVKLAVFALTFGSHVFVIGITFQEFDLESYLFGNTKEAAEGNTLKRKDISVWQKAFIIVGRLIKVILKSIFKFLTHKLNIFPTYVFIYYVFLSLYFAVGLSLVLNRINHGLSLIFIVLFLEPITNNITEAGSVILVAGSLLNTNNLGYSDSPVKSIYPNTHAQYDGSFSSLLSFFNDLIDSNLEVILNICDQLYFMYENLLSVSRQYLVDIFFNNYACQLFVPINTSETVTFPVDLPTFISLTDSIRNLILISIIPLIIISFLYLIPILKLYIIRFKKDKEYSNPTILKYVNLLKGLKLNTVYFILLFILLISILLASIYFSINFNTNIAIKLLVASPSWEKGAYIMPFLECIVGFVYCLKLSLIGISFFSPIIVIANILQEFDLVSYLFGNTKETAESNTVKKHKFWKKSIITVNRLVKVSLKTFFNFYFRKLRVLPPYIFVYYALMSILFFFCIYLVIYEINECLRLIFIVLSLEPITNNITEAGSVILVAGSLLNTNNLGYSDSPVKSIYPNTHAQYDGFFSVLLSFFNDLMDRILVGILNICEQLEYIHENLLFFYHQALAWGDSFFNNYQSQLFVPINTSETVTFPVDLPTFISIIASIRNLIFISYIPIFILTLLCFIIILKLYIIRFKKDKEYSNPIIKKYVEFLKGFKLYNVYFIFVVILLISIILASIYFSIDFNINIAIKLLVASPSWEKGPYIMPFLDSMLTYVYAVKVGVLALTMCSHLFVIGITFQEFDLESYLFGNNKETAEGNTLKRKDISVWQKAFRIGGQLKILILKSIFKFLTHKLNIFPSYVFIYYAVISLYFVGLITLVLYHINYGLSLIFIVLYLEPIV